MSATKDRNDRGVVAQAVLGQLERILSSAAFAQSERLSRFLRFAVEETLHGAEEQLKEYCIGVEVFDREETYDPRTDPIVRVEAGRLRARLAKYYETEGREDGVVIAFPKGSYVPTFENRQPRGGRLRAWLHWLRRPAVIALVAVSVLACAAIYQAARLSQELESLRRNEARQEFARNEFTPLWGRLLQAGSETAIVFGSPVFFDSPNHNLFIRLMGVNDPARFRMDPAFQSLEQRLGPLLGPRYDYALMGDARALAQLSAFFARAGCQAGAIPADRAVWDDLQNRNIVFLGAARMNPLLRRLPFQQDFELDAENNLHNRAPQPGEQAVYSTSDHREMTYAVVAHFPGLRAGHEIVVLTAHSEAGILGAVGEVTRAETARALALKLPARPPSQSCYYQMLLRVIADRGVPIKTEYVTHHAVNAPLR